jgi:hypothetical protein
MSTKQLQSHLKCKPFILFQRRQNFTAAAEFQLSSGLWVLVDPDNATVNENPLLLLLWLYKLRQKTTNYQAKDRSALRCVSLGAVPVPCNMHEY